MEELKHFWIKFSLFKSLHLYTIHSHEHKKLELSHDSIYQLTFSKGPAHQATNYAL